MSKKTFLRFIAPVFLILGLFSSCNNNSTNTDTFTIWTDRPEFVSYSELYNSLNPKSKAIVVYKPNLANSLPPAKDEEKPDLVVGSFLKNKRIKKNFRPLDGLLSEDTVRADTIYRPLLEWGKASGKQFLFPVSFNMPLVIFSVKNEYLLPKNYSISLDELKTTAAQFNAKNKDDFYVKMGFGPSWDNEFLYLVTKNFGQCFKEKGTSFTTDMAKLQQSVEYIKDWTQSANTSTTSEQDFQFKYLYTPKYRQVTEERTLFAYTSSEDIFAISSEQIKNLAFRWITVRDKIPVQDNMVSMAIYRKSRKPKEAEDFIAWFFQAENQKSMLERAKKMDLSSMTFGISGGFSSLHTVNELVFPTYYHTLLGNLPSEKSLAAPYAFPSRWVSLKERVVYPYLISAGNTNQEKQTESITQLLSAWEKQFD